jgi:hypothetical protein
MAIAARRSSLWCFSGHFLKGKMAGNPEQFHEKPMVSCDFPTKGPSKTGAPSSQFSGFAGL